MKVCVCFVRFLDILRVPLVRPVCGRCSCVYAIDATSSVIEVKQTKTQDVSNRLRCIKPSEFAFVFYLKASELIVDICCY